MKKKESALFFSYLCAHILQIAFLLLCFAIFAVILYLYDLPADPVLYAALLARCPDVPVYAAELDVLTQLTGFHLTRGMLCAMRRPKLRDPAVLLQDASRVAVLENVMNPTNLGAIFRFGRFRLLKSEAKRS